jgi:hypothetical protein
MQRSTSDKLSVPEQISESAQLTPVSVSRSYSDQERKYRELDQRIDHFAAPEGLLTLSYGGPKYIRMAQALSLSYRRHNSDRPFAIITDQASAHTLRAYFDDVIIVKPEYGPSTTQKLYVDLYSPFARTLFVDSDCLFYKHPDELWNLYAHGPFSIRGWRYLTGDTDYERRAPYRWVQDTSQFLKQNGISRFAHFNGGVFYFDRSETAKRVFVIGRSLYESREEFGFVPFKSAPISDEPAMAVAMEKCGIDMDPWDCIHGMETAIGMRKALAINVLKGESHFLKGNIECNPVLIHYNVDAQDGLVYTRDVCRLLYETSRVRPLLFWRAVAMTCAPALYKRVLRLAAEFPSRLKESVCRVFAVRPARPLANSYLRMGTRLSRCKTVDQERP